MVFIHIIYYVYIYFYYQCIISYRMENLGRIKNPFQKSSPKGIQKTLKNIFIVRIRIWKTWRKYRTSIEKRKTKGNDLYIREKLGHYKGFAFRGKRDGVTSECWVSAFCWCTRWLYRPHYEFLVTKGLPIERVSYIGW